AGDNRGADFYFTGVTSAGHGDREAAFVTVTTVVVLLASLLSARSLQKVSHPARSGLAQAVVAACWRVALANALARRSPRFCISISSSPARRYARNRISAHRSHSAPTRRSAP